MRIKNKKLYIETKKLIQEINDILRNYKSSQDITIMINNIDYERFLQFKKCYNILDSMNHIRATVIWDFINNYYFITKKPILDNKLFYKLYKDLESYIFKKNIFIAIGFLENFSSDKNIITLKTAYGIIRIEKFDKDKYIKEALKNYDIGHLDKLALEETDFLLSFKYEVTNAEFSNEKPSIVFNKLLTAFRIFRKGNVDIRMTIHRSLIRKYMNKGWFESKHKPPLFGERYELNKKDINSFRKFWKFFSERDIEKQNSLNLAIRRLNFSYNKIGIYDKIIDFIIGFESLFGGGEGEHRYKIAMRTAFLIKNDINKIEKIFETMKKAYTMRSKIVHGAPDNEIEKNKVSIYELDDYLRKSIRILLEKDLNDSKDIAKFTDNLILNKVK